MFKKRRDGIGTDPPDGAALMRSVKVVAVSLALALMLLITSLIFTVTDLHNTQALLVNGKNTGAKDAVQAAKATATINKIVDHVESQLLRLEQYGDLCWVRHQVRQLSVPRC